MPPFRFPHRQDVIASALVGANVGAAIQMMQENDRAIEDVIAERSSGRADYQESDPAVSAGGTFSGTWDIGGNRPYLAIASARANGVGEVWVNLDGGDGKGDGAGYSKSPPDGSDPQATAATLAFGSTTATFQVLWVPADGTSSAIVTVTLLAAPL